jgi:DNA polymerase III delta prime subunit
MTSLRRIILSSQDSAFVALLILVGGLAGAKDVVNLVVPGDVGLYLIILFFAAVLVRNLAHARKIESIEPLPLQPRIFNPFGGAASDDEFPIWPRDAEARKIAERIQNSANSHLIVSGPSGAGKSTLVERLVTPLINEHYNVRLYRNYAGIIPLLLEEYSADSDYLATQRSLIQRYNAFVSTQCCNIKDVFEPDFTKTHPNAEMLWNEIEAHLRLSFSSTRPTCFIFDQIERYLHTISSETHAVTAHINGFDLYFFMNFVRFCREDNKCRTVFIIRSDHLYESVDFLETIVSRQIHVGQVAYFLCPGINTSTSPQGVLKIRESFRKIGLAVEETQRFDHICGLESRTHSNTFMTQMVGFTTEHFFRTDPAAKRMLHDERDRSVSLRIYFTHFLNDYIRISPSADSSDVIKAVLFCVAAENSVTGRAASTSRVAAISHMPEDVVSTAIEFSRSKGILVEEFDDETPAYRFIHDLVSDYVRENEQFAIHPTLKDSMRGLIESRAETRNLTKVNRYADVLKDLWEDPNVGLAAIWAFFVFGGLKTNVELVCLWSFEILRPVPGAGTCDVVMRYYLPLYLLHVVWLMFIYHVDRDYLRRVLTSGILRRVSACMPIIGAGLAIVLSQSPALFVIPIVSVGLMMGVLLAFGTADGSGGGRDANERRQWGVRTILNMLIVSSLTVVTALVFWTDKEAQRFWNHVGSTIGGVAGMPGLDGGDVAYIWMYVVCLVMIYFWLHIRPEQQSRIAYAARLASYDRARGEADE